MPVDVSKLSGGSLIIAWQLKDKNVLLVGGGDVAAGRIENILIADARITLIAPRSGLHPQTKAYIDATPRITYHDRTFAGPEDLAGVDMVLTAIDDVETSREICAMSRALKIPTNVADIPPSCDFYFGSQVKRLPLQIMISTNGKGPRLAHLIRKKIEDSLPAGIENAIERVGELRTKLRERAPGVGGDLGKKRMGWMTDVCNTWELDDLALLDDAAIAKLLDDGWEKGEVPRPDEIFSTAKRAGQIQLPFSSLVPMAVGFFVGVACTAAAVHRLSARR
ncbi:siroheme synthase [Phanerochaete sordida]|uniref:precorrin-2 dehydrogenase n=1 Tax=Phanerochaete sordida TaxID=48140 RepID=A0A9P3G1Z6_9APHY|nr:siroheme synthase [Phanerochaete sordida]